MGDPPKHRAPQQPGHPGSAGLGERGNTPPPEQTEDVLSSWPWSWEPAAPGAIGADLAGSFPARSRVSPPAEGECASPAPGGLPPWRRRGPAGRCRRLCGRNRDPEFCPRFLCPEVTGFPTTGGFKAAPRVPRASCNVWHKRGSYGHAPSCCLCVSMSPGTRLRTRCGRRGPHCIFSVTRVRQVLCAFAFCGVCHVLGQTCTHRDECCYQRRIAVWKPCCVFREDKLALGAHVM